MTQTASSRPLMSVFCSTKQGNVVTGASCWVAAPRWHWLSPAPGHYVPAGLRDRQDSPEGRFRIPRSPSDIAVSVRTPVQRRNELSQVLGAALGGPSARFRALPPHLRSATEQSRSG